MTFNGRNLDNISPFGSDDKPLGKVSEESAEIILNAALVFAERRIRILSQRR